MEITYIFQSIDTDLIYTLYILLGRPFKRKNFRNSEFMNFSIKKISFFLHISELNLKNFNFLMALFPHHLLMLAWSGVSGVAIDIVQGGILHYSGK